MTIFRASPFLLAAVAGLVLLGCDDDDGNDQASRAGQPPAEAVEDGSPTPGSGGGNILATANQSLQSLVAEVQSSVVTVVVDQGEGSGVVWDGEGRVITNQHVVAGSQSISVVLASGEEFEARLIAGDRLTDIAVLQVEGQDLRPAEFRPELPEVGSLVLAVGNPLGFESSVTLGIVSGLHREIPSGGTTPALVDLIQTDAAISPGNSGGALVDASGAVIGINVAYLPPAESGAVAIGFAIPAATVVDVVEQLLEDGTVEYAFLDIQPRPLTPGIAQQLGLSVQEGVLVFGVSPGGAADQGGMLPGDVIVSFAGEEIATVEDLFAAIRERSPGDDVEVVVVREGNEETLEITLGERPQGS